MKNNKVYLQKDALSRHEDFDVWYGDGDLALSARGTWSDESDKICLIGRMGGEIGRIKPDHNTLAYTIRVERYEYVLHTLRIFEHYEIEGMLWQVNGTLSDPPLSFVNEKTHKEDVHVRLTDFKDWGPCYEIRVTDIAKLRIATAAVIAIGVKEAYKGKSEGEKCADATKLARVREFLFPTKGTAYADLLKEEKRVPEQ